MVEVELQLNVCMHYESESGLTNEDIEKKIAEYIDTFASSDMVNTIYEYREELEELKDET